LVTNNGGVVGNIATQTGSPCRLGQGALMTNGLAAFMAAVSGTSLIAYLLMGRTKTQDRRARRQSAGGDGGDSFSSSGSSDGDIWSVLSSFGSDSSSSDGDSGGDGGGGGD
jgi:hypothetical protein